MCYGALTVPTVPLTTWNIGRTQTQIQLNMAFKEDDTSSDPQVLYSECKYSVSYVSGISQYIWDSSDTVSLVLFDDEITGPNTRPYLKLRQNSYDPQVVGLYEVTAVYSWAYGTAS